MPAHKAIYANGVRSPSTVVDIPSFIAYLKQEREDVVIPLRDGKYDGATGSSKDSADSKNAGIALRNRLDALLEMLTNSPMNKEILESSNLTDTLHIIAKAPAFNSPGCKNTAQELQARFAARPDGARENIDLGRPNGNSNCTVYGHNGLTPGQTWLKPNAADAAREAGAHASQGGIYGHPLAGAYSVSLKHSQSSLNRDKGIEVLYGTRGGAEEINTTSLTAPFRETHCLRASIRTKIPIRLLRFAGEDGAPYGPAEGWRYDGLYRVTAVQEATNEKGGKFEQFTLERSPLDDNEGKSLADFCDGNKEARKQLKEKLGSDKDVAAAEAQRQSCNVTVPRGDGKPNNAQGEASGADAETMEQENDQES